MYLGFAGLVCAELGVRPLLWCHQTGQESDVFISHLMMEEKTYFSGMVEVGGCSVEHVQGTSYMSVSAKIPRQQ